MPRAASEASGKSLSRGVRWLVGVERGNSNRRPSFNATDRVICDYSLGHLQNRKARVGDKLISTQFNSSITRGFTEPKQPLVAVCLLPGTEVAFDAPVMRSPLFGEGILPNRRVAPGLVAKFTQLNVDNPTTHHDALEFPGGETVLLAMLATGQTATVLQMPAVGVPEKAEREIKFTPIDEALPVREEEHIY